MNTDDAAESKCLKLPETHTLGPKEINQQTGLASYTSYLVKKKRTSAGHKVDKKFPGSKDKTLIMFMGDRSYGVGSRIKGLTGLASLLFGATFHCFDEHSGCAKRETFNESALPFFVFKTVAGFANR